MTDQESEDRRRVDQEAEQNKSNTDSERNETPKDADKNPVVIAIERVAEKLNRQADENTPEKKRERCWHHAEVIGLWAAAAVGVAAILVGNHDSQHSISEANRAWIAPRTVYLATPLVINEHPHFRVSFDNPGKQPALNTDLRTQILVADNSAVDAALKDIKLWPKSFGGNGACDSPSTNSGTEIYWPSPQPEAYTLYFGGERSDPVVTAEILDGSQAIIVNGCVFYETFGEMRRSKFCFLVRQPSSADTGPKAQIGICPAGNDAT